MKELTLDEKTNITLDRDLLSTLIKKYKNEFEKSKTEQNLVQLVRAFDSLVHLLCIQQNNTEMREYRLQLFNLLNAYIPQYPNNVILIGILSSIYGNMANESKIIIKKIQYGKKALACINIAEKEDCNNRYVKLWYAGHYMNAPAKVGGDKEKAKLMLEKLCNENSDDIWAHYLLLDCYLRMDKQNVPLFLKKISEEHGNSSLFVQTLKCRLEK